MAAPRAGRMGGFSLTPRSRARRPRFGCPRDAPARPRRPTTSASWAAPHSAADQTAECDLPSRQVRRAPPLCSGPSHATRLLPAPPRLVRRAPARASQGLVPHPAPEEAFWLPTESFRSIQAPVARAERRRRARARVIRPCYFWNSLCPNLSIREHSSLHRHRLQYCKSD